MPLGQPTSLHQEGLALGQPTLAEEAVAKVVERPCYKPIFARPPKDVEALEEELVCARVLPARAECVRKLSQRHAHTETIAGMPEAL